MSRAVLRQTDTEAAAAGEGSAMLRTTMTLTQLEYFVAVVEHGSFSAAATALHVAQSTVSTAVAQLERAVGCDLLRRTPGQGTAPTPAGQVLLGDARRLLAAAGDIEALPQRMRDEVVGQLAVACYRTIAPVFLPPVLTELWRRHPELTVTVHEGDIATIVDLLRSGVCEAALSYDLDIPGDIEMTPLARLRPYAIVAPGHPCAGRGSVRLAELAAGTMVFLDLPDTARFMDRVLAAAGARPARYLRMSSFETMRGLVAAGAGFAIINQRLGTDQTSAGGCVVPLRIEDDIPDVAVGLCRPVGAQRTGRAAVLESILAAVLADAGA